MPGSGVILDGVSPTPIPHAAISAPSPTSRSVFRHLARAVGATNRAADTLRLDLLARWAATGRPVEGPGSLMATLAAVDELDPAGALGAEARLAAWFRVPASDDVTGSNAEANADAVTRWTVANDVAPEAAAEIARLVRVGG